ncbi:MAG: hypothetical protein HQK59_09620 [Deltaproteobacteria bacterium]|nr:hypothetical protein [Deltaproteobacteria bacterium]
MKRNPVFWCVTLLFLVFCFGPAWAAEVSQGNCISVNEKDKTLTIDEYDLNFTKDKPYGHPTGKNSTYNIATALIGIPPAKGDVVRISYDVKGTERIALKIMNVSKQDLKKK